MRARVFLCNFLEIGLNFVNAYTQNNNVVICSRPNPPMTYQTDPFSDVWGGTFLIDTSIISLSPYSLIINYLFFSSLPPFSFPPSSFSTIFLLFSSYFLLVPFVSPFTFLPVSPFIIFFFPLLLLLIISLTSFSPFPFSSPVLFFSIRPL